MDIKAAIKAFGSQERLADALGVKRQHVSYWLKNGIPVWRKAAIEKAVKDRRQAP